MTTEPTPVITDWLYLTQQASDGLAVWAAWLRAWQSHPALGHVPVELFDSVLADMQAHGLGAIINDKTTRSLRRTVTGENKQ